METSFPRLWALSKTPKTSDSALAWCRRVLEPVGGMADADWASAKPAATGAPPKRFVL